MASPYPDNWKEIALAVKQQAQWRCSKCGMQCIRPEQQLGELSFSQRMSRTLQVHHWNRNPADNRKENLSALCSGCHLYYHSLSRGNITPGQLSLFADKEFN